MIDVRIINYKEAYIKIYYKDYAKIKKNKSIYEIKIINRYGKLKIKDFFKKNRYILISIFFGIGVIYFLSMIVFDIEVIHSNKDIRTLITNELKNYGIHKYIIKKSYNEIEKIEDKILENNKDRLEWIEITENGSYYIVRVEERKIKNDTNTDSNNNIVSKKNAIITSIIANKGEKIKKINDYVSAGDVIISGSITKPDGSVIISGASGKVCGEVWYNVRVDYPLVYKEETLTGKVEDVLTLNIFNKKYYFFGNKTFKTYDVESKTILSHNLLPINLTFDKQYELNVIDEIYSIEEAIDMAIEKAKKKLLSNSNILNINKITILEKNMYPSKVSLKLFISVQEDITSYEPIKNDSLLSQ